MEYRIVSSNETWDDGLDFARMVCELMQEGWTPQGGVFCIVESDGDILAYKQAMIRMETAARQVNIRGWESVTLPPSLLKVDG